MKPAGRYFFLWFTLFLLTAACSTTRRIPESDFLYKGANLTSVDSIDNDILKVARTRVLFRENTTFVGIPYKLMLYNISAGRKKRDNVLSSLIAKIAEPPVLLSQIDTVVMLNRIRQHLYSAGYFQPKVSFLPAKNGKTATINYSILGGKRYKIGKVFYPQDSSVVMHAIASAIDSSLLHAGDYIRPEVLAKERERINEDLKNKGYFSFNPDNIAYHADTANAKENNLHLYVKPGTTASLMKPWKIGSVVIHLSNPLKADSLNGGTVLQTGHIPPRNTGRIAGYRPAIYRDALLLKQGDIYSKKNHYLSIQRLLNLETFQFVKFSFEQHSTDSVNLLTTHLYVTPLKKYHLKFEVSAGAKGNNYLGTKLSSSVINSNVFGGAEKLQLELLAGADIQFGGNRLGANSFNVGGKLSLAMPRLLPRLGIGGGLNPTLPQTKVSLGSTYITVPKLFAVNVSALSLDYLFRSNRKAEHNIIPLDISTFALTSTSALFDSALVLVPSLQRTFRSQIVLGSSYRFWIDKPARAGAWLNGGAGFKIKSSGNLLSLFVKNKTGEPGNRKLLGMPIAQFVKLEGELRGYFKVNAANTVALRSMAGFGIAYGNSVALPYSEQFFIGGSNSLRAFRAGTIGPGSYQSESKVISNIEYGDFKIEMNGEWRHAVNSTVKLAAFMDAGNVWLRKEDPAKPGAGFHDIISELALGGGAGLRFDFSLVVVRFDAAFPFRKPWYEKGERWVFREFAPFEKSWRKENLILNIGVGYPF
jgi:outer membrane protein insertion porin family